MNLRKEKRALFFTILSFFTFLFITVSTAYAEERSSGSTYIADGEIKLKWNHSLSVPKALTFTKVDANTETFEEGGAAIADAAATSSLEPGDTGEVRTFVTLDGGAFGFKALANSSAVAHNFFLLKNNTSDYIRVNFDWSAEWLVNGAIQAPSIDRSEVGLHLKLAKRRLKYLGRRAINDMVHDMKGRIKTRDSSREHGRKHRRYVFTRSVAAHLPIRGAEFYDSDSIKDGFEISMGPEQAYLFMLHTQAAGLATVSVEGCSGRFWKRHKRNWPINRHTKFYDIFGVGPDAATLWSVLRRSESNDQEAMLMSNAVAALLNITSSRISYHIDDVDTLVEKVDSAFLQDNSDLNNDLEYHNNLGAPYVCKSSLIH